MALPRSTVIVFDAPPQAEQALASWLAANGFKQRSWEKYGFPYAWMDSPLTSTGLNVSWERDQAGRLVLHAFQVDYIRGATAVDRMGAADMVGVWGGLMKAGSNGRLQDVVQAVQATGATVVSEGVEDAAAPQQWQQQPYAQQGLYGQQQPYPQPQAPQQWQPAQDAGAQPGMQPAATAPAAAWQQAQPYQPPQAYAPQQGYPQQPAYPQQWQQQGAYPQGQPYGYPQAQQQWQQPAAGGTDRNATPAIASVALGCVGILLMLLGYVLGPVLSIAGIALGVRGLQSPSKKALAIVGIVLCSLSAAFGLLVLIMSIAAAAG